MGFLTLDPPFLCPPRVLPTTPVGPSLPGHRSTRPYTVFELEQVRQQSRKYAGECAGLCREAGQTAMRAPPHQGRL